MELRKTAKLSRCPRWPGTYKWIDAGSGHRACGVLTDGTVNCWFTDENNQAQSWALGDAPGEDDIGYETVSMDWRGSACGLRTDRTMKCWIPYIHHYYGVRDWTISSTSPWRNSADLLGLQVSDAALSPAFGRAATAYTATVANGIDSVSIAPELTNSLAVYTIYSDTDGAAGEDGIVNLSVGANVIKVRVVSADRSATKTYTVTVTRESA